MSFISSSLCYDATLYSKTYIEYIDLIKKSLRRHTQKKYIYFKFTFTSFSTNQIRQQNVILKSIVIDNMQSSRCDILPTTINNNR